MKQEKIYIYGKHAVEEAQRNIPKAVEKVEKIGPKSTLPSEIGKNANHQGVIALVNLDKLVRPYKEFVKDLKINSDTAFVLMGELQDPQNVGAVIRSSVAMGISAILIPEHNQVQITPAVVKVSAGMVFSIPIVSIGNVNNVIRDLKDRGFWIYGLEGTAKESLDEQKFEEPTVFVLGNESKGIREKTTELCDILLRIPMNPRCESMNVAASTAIALYAWSTKHPKALE
jgi:23S rRNA (guanosine2251-2'-O)-methyltransferase